MVDPASNLNSLTAHPLPHAHWQPRSRSRCDSGSQADRLSSSSLVTVDPAQISESGSDPADSAGSRRQLQGGSQARQCGSRRHGATGTARAVEMRSINLNFEPPTTTSRSTGTARMCSTCPASETRALSLRVSQAETRTGSLRVPFVRDQLMQVNNHKLP